MDPKLVAAIVVAIVAVLVIVWDFARNQRTARLRRRFGTEYDLTVQEVGPQTAEPILLEREKGGEKFQIRKLTAGEREQFEAEWRGVQWRFIDDRRGAVVEADLLASRLMQLRGYPTAAFAQHTAEISARHARAVDNYLAAHRIAIRYGQGLATTEDLRHALIYYYSLFAELLECDSIDRQREVA